MRGLDVAAAQKAPSERSFGHLLAVVAAVFCGYEGYAGHARAAAALGLCVLALLLVARVRPQWLQRPLRLWMRLGEWMGRIVNPVVLGLIFFVVLTPVALAGRLLGRDPLRQRRVDKAHSYWVEVPDAPKPPESFRNQF